MDERLKAFERLLTVMDELREKCPWDKKQTFESLRNLTIEETYELADAITSKDLKEVQGELGDLFLHLVFYCKLGDEQGAFNVTSVLNGICEKLIHRHPHVYGDLKVSNDFSNKSTIFLEEPSSLFTSVPLRRNMQLPSHISIKCSFSRWRT